MAPAKYNCTTVSISSPKDASYTNVVEVPVFLGWKIVGEPGGNVAGVVAGGASGPGPVGLKVGEQNTGAGLLFFFQSLNTTKPVVYNKIESIVVVSHRHSHYTESSLIQKLEDLGIGRPSTFATIVDTIQERGYVKRQDVEGIQIDCTEFVLREHTLEETTKSKIFGQEKNKLVLQPIGLATVEFLVDHFQPLFNYDYTKQMEEDLEKVSEADWQTICAKCENLIKTLAKPVSKMAKPVYLVSSRDGSVQYELCFHQYGTSLKRISENGEPEYKKVNSKIKIDIELAKSGKYIAEDLLEIQNDNLGKYGEEDVFVKTGKYGPYIQCGTKTVSTKSLGKSIESITLEDALVLLNPEVCGDKSSENLGTQSRAPPAPKNPNILRILNSDISIRKGKYGAYIYYMPADAKKPEFFQLGKMKTKYANMDTDELIKWIGETYNVCVSYQNK
jgi:DNA topoisomerase-1